MNQAIKATAHENKVRRGETFTQPQRTNCPQPTRSHIENGLVKIER